jgi:hypothetical protein
MTKGWKLVCLSCLMALMILSIAGCGGKPSIVGNWQSTADASITVEFTQNGNLIINTGNHIYNGTYALLSDNYFSVKFNGLAGALIPLFQKDTWKYEVTKSDLTLSADTDIKTYKRVEK